MRSLTESGKLLPFLVHFRFDKDPAPHRVHFFSAAEFFDDKLTSVQVEVNIVKAIEEQAKSTGHCLVT